MKAISETSFALVFWMHDMLAKNSYLAKTFTSKLCKIVPSNFSVETLPITS